MKVLPLLSPLLLYGLYAGVMYVGQLNILFPMASSRHHAFADNLPPGARLVEIPASFGQVRAIFSAPESGAPAPAILFAHGNFDRAQDYAGLFRPLANRGIGVLALEYPGYDGADGLPDSATLDEAASVAYDWLARQPDVDKTRIAGMGYSIGGGVVADLSGRRRLAALVLLSTFTSIAEMAHRYALPDFLLRLRYDNVARLAAFDGPVLIVHGRRDRVIPFESGQRLAQVAPRATLLAFDCGHDDCGLAANLFERRLPEWLAANGLLSRSPMP